MIRTIFLKELKETLRDKRTIIVMVIVPILIFPLVFKLTSSFKDNVMNDVKMKEMKLGVVGQDDALQQFVLQKFDGQGGFKWIEYQDTSEVLQDIKEGKLDIGLWISSDFGRTISANGQSTLKLFYDATNIGYSSRLSERLESYNSLVSEQRLAANKIDAKLFNAIEILETNTASDREMMGNLVGGMLPYIFIMFGFMGCMYPAIDLFTGEKERGTVETLLTTPVKRWQILFGKMGVVVLSGLLAAIFSLIGLAYGFNAMGGDMEGEAAVIFNIAEGLMDVKTIALMFAMLIPLIIFFAGILIPISINAKSFKEAQSIITPLNLVLIIPGFLGMMPGVEYNFGTALIPILNVALATKQILAGNTDFVLFSLTLLSLLVLAFTAVLISNRQFGLESNISST